MYHKLASMFYIALSLIALATISPSWVQGQSTRVGYYSRSCPRVESIVKQTVQSHFKSNPSIAPGLLRMHFHDCFVQGCDGSVLLSGGNTEKTAGPNRGLQGWEVIDDAKTKLEAACPGLVSCADILALAARDSVVLTKGIDWKVPTGRLDGKVSLASETSTLPGFRDSMEVQKSKFKTLGLNTQDLVTLVGGHTIGTTACQLFSYRLYNFNTTDVTDPAISPSFISQLKSLCPQNGDGAKRVDLDTGSANRFDATFFTNLKNGRGILESDQLLWTDVSTRSFVQRFLGIRGLRALNFNVEFGRSMVKMSTQNGDGAKRVDLDTGSANRFDATFFTNLKNGRGILESDQLLWTDVSTRSFVQRFLGIRGLRALNFNVEFGRSMVKMSKIGLKTPAQGEVRRICSAIN